MESAESPARIRYSPASTACQVNRERIVAGQALPLAKQSELFTDSWGQPADVLRVLAAYCHFAVIYRKSPVGLPMPGLLAKAERLNDEKLNRLLQQLAWSAVRDHPLSGV